MLPGGMARGRAGSLAEKAATLVHAAPTALEVAWRAERAAFCAPRMLARPSLPAISVRSLGLKVPRPSAAMAVGFADLATWRSPHRRRPSHRSPCGLRLPNISCSQQCKICLSSSPSINRYLANAEDFSAGFLVPRRAGHRDNSRSRSRSHNRMPRSAAHATASPEKPLGQTTTPRAPG